MVATKPQAVLDRAQHFLSEHVEPHAHRIDREPAALQRALAGLREQKLMALRRPVEFGGPGLSDADYRRFQVMVARRSGALAFLQQQHQSAVRMIAAGHNDALKHSALPVMDAERVMGIGYSQLRRPGPPMLRATPRDDGGFLIDGTIPWVTGVGFYPEVLLGAELPDGRALFGIAPLSDQQRADGRITIGPPMKLAALEVACTCEVTLEAWPIEDAQVARIEPPGWMAARDAQGVAGKSWLILGCGRGAADVLARKAPDAGAAMHALLDDARDRLVAAEAEPLAIQAEARADVVALAGRAAHAAVSAAGGAANVATHDAQRVYREVLMFTVLGQTEAVREATIGRLV